MNTSGSVSLRRWEEALESGLPADPLLLEIPRGVFADEEPVRFDEPHPRRVRALRRRLGLLATRPGLARLRVTSLTRVAGRSRLRLGSSAGSADVVLAGSGISYCHGELIPGARQSRLVDLESAGGSYVEGRRIAVGIPAPVVPGQVVRFGFAEFLLLAPVHLARFVREPGVAERLAPSDLCLPPEGVDLRVLAPRVARLSCDELLGVLPPAAFLLQLPDAGETAVRRSRRTARVHAVCREDGHADTLGRAVAVSDLVLPRESVSKRHARLRWNPRIGQWSVVDLESTNGTFLGDRRLPPGIATPVPSGAVLAFSTYRAVFLKPTKLHELACSVLRQAA